EADGAITIEVSDEGDGFDTRDATRGFGLVGMRERVELVGGPLEIESAPGTGTRIRATLPARRVASDAEPDHQGAVGVRSAYTPTRAAEARLSATQSSL